MKNWFVFLCLFSISTFGFCQTITKGNFVAFKGVMENSKVTAIVFPSAFALGLVGGIISAAIISPKRYYYVTSLRRGNTKRLNKKYVEQRLSDTKNNELINGFQSEIDKNFTEVLLKYVNLLNQNLSTNPHPESLYKN